MKPRTSSNLENPLNELFVSELADIHSAEKQLAKALLLMAKAAQSKDLKELLEVHQDETKGHVTAIEEIAESLGVKLPRKTCHAMRGLIEEGVIAMLKNIKSSVLDTALIAAGRKIEHYEIASYGTLCRWAEESTLAASRPALPRWRLAARATSPRAHVDFCMTSSVAANVSGALVSRSRTVMRVRR